MIRGFTFERALSWPFSAPHLATFPWLFGAAYAAVWLFAIAVIGFSASGPVIDWAAAASAAEEAQDPELFAEAMGRGLLSLAPWAGVSILTGWVIWAMFETASQRRYIWGKPFTLGFGRDELNMMWVGLAWTLLGLVIMAIPVLMAIGGVWAAIASAADGLTDEEAGQRIAAPIFGAIGLILLLLPVYAFFATRLAPCFGLTVKDGRIRFFDAWHVSRGRFWAIFGAYLILAFAGAILGQVVTGIAQVIMLSPLIPLSAAAPDGQEVIAQIASPGFLVPMGLFLFVSLFLQGLLQHVVGGPAAFAARLDPRGGVEDEVRVNAFT
ncbi:MAG: hypothetical protein ACO33A_07040 [Hyphomonas sp.]